MSLKLLLASPLPVSVALACALLAPPAFAQSAQPDREHLAAQIERLTTEARDRAREAARLAREQALEPQHLDALITQAVEAATAGIGLVDRREIVKDAPFSADVVYETRQTLGDGNRIVRSSMSFFARDGMGRTRQQRSPQAVLIDDPVAGRAYLLHPDSRTAVRLPRGSVGGAALGRNDSRQIEVRPGRVLVHRRSGETRDDVRVEVIRIGGDGAEHDVQVREMPALPPLTLNGQPLALPMARGPGVTESLGVRDIDGVRAEGTRTTYTIPTGAIGNEKPIVSSRERWFSPELQVVLVAATSDPRSGDTVYRLTNIKRGEPAPELFRIPPDVRVRGDPPKPRE